MSENTKIEWCDHTFNPWWGCTKVDPGCDHCYAATWAKRFGVEWGVGAERRYSSEAVWQQPHKWNRAAAYHPTTVLATGEAIPHAYRPRVFVASMGDVLDKAVPQDWRERLWTTIEDCPALDWLILTKRPQLIRRMVPARWRDRLWPRNIWLGVSVSDDRGRWRIPLILREKVAVHFVSYEPAVGPLTLPAGWASHRCNCPHDYYHPYPGEGRFGHYIGCPQSKAPPTLRAPWANRIDWVIAGGESGPGARPCDIAWLRSMVQQCQAAGVAVFVKQVGAKPIEVERWSCEGDGVPETSMRFDLHLKSRKGSDPEEWPSDLRVRQFPEVPQ